MKTISIEQLACIRRLLPAAAILEKKEDYLKYASDKTEQFVFLPELVLLPNTTEEVSAVLAFCYKENIPVTTRGGGTGLSAGALPVAGGLVLSMERFDKIIEIDEANLQVTTEAAVITEVLQNALKEKGLYYPPDPSSRGSSFIGGNIATNAGGPRAVKYGVVKDYVLNLEVVLPDGRIIWTGANTLKNSTGYNITQLMVGSEGTLGVITKAVLKLIPYPKYRLLLCANFDTTKEACQAVSAIFRAGIIPSCLEFIEKDAIDITIDYLGETAIKIPENTAAQLLIEVDGQYLEPLYSDCEKIDRVLQKFNCGEVLFADNAEQSNALWKLRRTISSAIKEYAACKKADTVVPRANLPELIEGIKEIAAAYKIRCICYGHAGDGNLHVNIIRENCSDTYWETELPKAQRAIFRLVKKLKGTISGEHGIGWVQREFMDEAFSPDELFVQRSVKKAFDPKGLFNPHKLFPD